MVKSDSAFAMKLYKHPSGEFEGYWVKDVLRYCVKHGLAEKFDRWYAGSTGGMIPAKSKGKPCMKLIVFRWDWERFIAGYPNMD